MGSSFVAAAFGEFSLGMWHGMFAKWLISFCFVSGFVRLASEGRMTLVGPRQH